jgi:hypothetical protein
MHLAATVAGEQQLTHATPARRVKGIVAEAEEDGYWYHASRDGSRESHYRGERGAGMASEGSGQAAP